jgi:hypothetical protein
MFTRETGGASGPEARLYAEGTDLRAMPIRWRKLILKRRLRGRDDLVVMDGVAGEGSRLFQGGVRARSRGHRCQTPVRSVRAGNEVV